MTKRKIIIDCDPGIDDALALLLALKSETLDILGITICSGNVPAQLGAENAYRVLAHCGMTHIPIFIGEPLPLVRELVTAQDTHGEDGLGETYFPLETKPTFSHEGISFILDTLTNEEDVSIIALGPLTNIAAALQRDRAPFERLSQFVSMGGAYRIHGNCSPVAEFNYWVDPDAADYVYKHLPCLIHMIGLDVTRQIVLTPNILECIARFDTKLASFITAITRFYIDFHWEQEGIIGCVINDPLAVAYFLDPSLCQSFESYVTVVKQGEALGQTMVDSGHFYRQPANALIATDVDRKRFMQLFLKALFKEHCTTIDRLTSIF